MRIILFYLIMIQKNINKLNMKDAISLACNSIKDTLKIDTTDKDNNENDDYFYSLVHGVIMYYDKKECRPIVQFLNGLQVKEKIKESM